jgi:hypothetical protein
VRHNLVRDAALARRAKNVSHAKPEKAGGLKRFVFDGACKAHAPHLTAAAKEAAVCSSNYHHYRHETATAENLQGHQITAQHTTNRNLYK